MIKTRISNKEVKIVKARIGQLGTVCMDIETVCDRHTYKFVKPVDLVADGGFGEIGKAIFRSMK